MTWSERWRDRALTPEMRDIIASVRNPWRYTGGEVGSRVKPWDDADVRVCLAFPDAYEIGMSHLGLSILYHIVNDQPRMLAERAFAPWADMEAELRSRRASLFSLETHRPLADFDILGFSLAYELTYTNVLNMLELAGIPLRTSSRSPARPAGGSLVARRSQPLVIAGGPCTFNPMPMSPFFDAIVIGDGENAILQEANAVVEWKKTYVPRIKLLEKLSAVKGVYVPLIHGFDGERRATSGERRFVGKATIPDLNTAPFPRAPVAPHKATQERLAVEVARGCTRGCRFCQAGYIYRPARQRSGEAASKLACDGLKSTGAEEFSFLSLSVGDWSPLESALAAVHEGIGQMPVNASLPSLRAESLSQGLVQNLGRERAGSFTLAPEAATERMRRFINKGNTDEDLYSSVEKVFSNGWHAVKLYFMVGLPGETDAEIEGIVRIANRCLDIGRRYHRRPEVTVSTSTFVPKAHTPFQWEAQISISRAEEIQKKLKRDISRRGLFYRWHDAGMNLLEGVFSRGGPELASVIEKAHKSGARFDGWDENFDLKRWLDAFLSCGIDPEKYLEERPPDFVFPWEFLGAGPTREFLECEKTRALELQPTPDCSRDKCSQCGMCDFKDVKNRIEEATEQPSYRATKLPSNQAIKLSSYKAIKYRLRYTKTGKAAFLGSIETLDAMRRALRAAGLPVRYSEGYHPRAQVSFGPALPVGIESECEFADIFLSDDMQPADIVSRLAGHLPAGLEVIEARPLKKDSPSIEDSVADAEYEVRWEGKLDPAAIERFNEANTVPFKRTRGEKAVDVNLKDYITKLAVSESGVLEVGVRNIKPALKVSEVISAILGISDDDLKKLQIKKINVYTSD